MLRFGLFNELSTCGSGDGRVYCAYMSPQEYEVLGWDSTGAEILRISRNMPPVLKTQEEVEDEVFYVHSYAQRRRSSHRPLGFDYEPEPYRNMIADVDIGPDGNLWVRRGTRVEPFFDIYDLDGNLLRHAVYPDPGWSWETEGTPYGILAWEMDPLEGYQKLYLLR